MNPAVSLENKDMVTFKEQPGIEYPQELAERGFEDYSFRNDLAGNAFNETRCLSVWCMEENPAHRENDSWPRYSVERATEDGDQLGGDALLKTESLSEVLAYIDSYKES